MEVILQGLLILLSFILPFEVRTPILSIPPFMVFTNLELVAFLLISAWAIRKFLLGRFHALKGGLTVLSGLLIAVALLSALAADVHRFGSIKFTMRLATGFILFHIVADLGKRPDRIVKTVIAGAGISSVVGIWTCLMPEQSAWLTSWFRDKEFLIGNAVRLSGTFEYPNIAAAFLEMGFVLSFAYFPEKIRGKVILGLAQGLIFTGLVMTLSRAGMAGALFGLILVAGLYTARDGVLLALRRMGPSICIAIFCFTVVLALYPPLSLRIRTEGDRTWYNASYQTLHLPPFFAGSQTTVNIRLTNTGKIPWSPKGAHPFRLSYHWLKAETEEAFPSFQARTELPGEIGPGESVTLIAKVIPPVQRGEFLLAWDMVHENVAWFSQKGCAQGIVSCFVGEAPADRPFQMGRVEEPPDPTSLLAGVPGRATLWKAGWALFKNHPVLGVGPDNFRWLWGPAIGLERWNQHLHANNLFLEVLVTTGILGGIVFLLLLFSILRVQVRSIRRNWEGSPSREFSRNLALFGATIVFLVHGIVDYFLAFTPIYLLFWTIAGLSVAEEETPSYEASE